MISILLPTLGEREVELERLFDSLERQTNNNFELVIITQGNHQSVENLLARYSFKKIQIKIEKKGLSLARNIGIKKCGGKAVLLSDDDAWYPEYAIDIIHQNLNNEVFDVACFMIFDPIVGKYYKNYSKHNKDVNQIDIMRKSSIEICFNLSKVGKEKVFFDEDFGLGSKYPSGEENIILYNLYKNGYKIKFFNEIIVYHPKKQKIILDEQNLLAKGALFTKLYGRLKGIVLLNCLIFKHWNKIKINKIRVIYSLNKKMVSGNLYHVNE